MASLYRAFWVSGRKPGGVLDLDHVLRQGHSISHFGIVSDGVLVITDGTSALPQNTNDQRTRTDD